MIYERTEESCPHENRQLNAILTPFGPQTGHFSPGFGLKPRLPASRTGHPATPQPSPISLNSPLSIHLHCGVRRSNRHAPKSYRCPASAPARAGRIRSEESPRTGHRIGGITRRVSRVKRLERFLDDSDLAGTPGSDPISHCGTRRYASTTQIEEKRFCRAKLYLKFPSRFGPRTSVSAGSKPERRTGTGAGRADGRPPALGARQCH